MPTPWPESGSRSQSAGCQRLLQQNEIGHWFNGDEADRRMKGLVLADSNLFGLRILGQPLLFLLAESCDSLFHVRGDFPLDIIRSGHEPVKAA